MQESFSIQDGHLFFDGLDTVKLAEMYGTPAYIMSERIIRKNCRIYKDAINEYFEGKGLPLYASKAFSAICIYKIINDEGLGTDVVSGGELYTALKAGFPASKIYFHGNNKTDNELKMAIENDVGHIVVDNHEELVRLNNIAKEYNKVVNISFRIKPGISAHTHEFIQTGQIDSKFGVALENGEAYDIFRIASMMDNVNIVGVHCHIGSQIFDTEPFALAAKVMIEFMVRIRNDFGITLNELNLGGGFGIQYLESDTPRPYNEYIRFISQSIKETCSKFSFPVPFILFEPGRSIVGAAGITLYQIGAVKEIKDIRTYVSVDGGMCDNPRFILYESPYSMIISNKASLTANKKVTIAGKCCESGDLLQKDVLLQNPEAGDILCVFDTGAYNYSMSSNYNRIPRPPVIMITDGKARIVIRRESFEHIIADDIG